MKMKSDDVFSGIAKRIALLSEEEIAAMDKQLKEYKPPGDDEDGMS